MENIKDTAKNNQEKQVIKASNIEYFVWLSLYPIGISGITLLLTKTMEMPFFYLFLLVLQCFILITVLNFYSFYEEYIEIYYPIRIGKKRRRKIYYSEIERVRYFSGGKGSPVIGIHRIGKKYNIYTPANSFTIRTFKKSQKTLKFLQSKGIPIEIKSEREKIQRMLD